MKYIFNLSIAVLVSTFFFSSCKKVENRTILSSNPTVPVLSATPATVIIDSNTAADDLIATTFKWTASDYGFDAPVKYTLQIAPKASLWTSADVKSVPMGNDLMKGYSNLDLNNMMAAYGATPFEVSKLKARVMSELVNTKIKALYSNEIEVSVTPYVDPTPPVADKFYLPGDYQGWGPDKTDCGYLESTTMDGKFSGFFEETKADGTASSGEFKMTPAPNWDYDFGDAGTNYTDPNTGTGTLGPKSNGTNGTNFKLVNGTYFLNIDTVAKTWSYELRNWGLIGDATPGGWGSDQNMRYNYDTKLFEITINLVAGQFKFRLNDDWTTNLGSTAPNDGDIKPLNGDETPCSQGGKNFGVVDAGSYTLKLDPINNKCYVTKN